MNRSRLTSKAVFIFVFVIIILLSPVMARALSIDDVSITPTNATTTTALSCLVNASGTGTLQGDITWFVDSTPHGTDNETISLTSGVQSSTTVLGNLEGADTTKGEHWVCQATVNNGTDFIAQNSSSVLIQNSVPVVTFPSIQVNVTEHENYSQNATAFDADGDTIVNWISSDLNASSYAGKSLFEITSSGLINFTPTQSDVGNHTMAILAFDGEGFGGQNIIYSVAQVNDPPYFLINLTNQVAYSNISYSYQIFGADEEGDPFNFSISSSNSNITITPTGSTSANISFIGGIPSAGDEGLYQLNVTVYDRNNLSSNTTQTITMNVTTVNTPPVLAFIPNQTGTQGQNFSFAVSATDADTADQLSFAITPECSIPNPWNISSSINASTNATGLVNVTLTNDHIVCRTVLIQVFDYRNGVARGGSDSQLVFLNLTNINDPPTIQNLSYNTSNTLNQTNITNLTASTFALFSYQVNATDPDQLTYAGDNLTYTDNTSLFNINNASGVIQFTPGVADIGNHVVLITVTDAAGLSANQTLNITVIGDTAPSAPLIQGASSFFCQQDVACVYNVTANDADNDQLAFTSNLSFVGFTNLSTNVSDLNATYSNQYVGNYSLLLTATDIWGHTNSSVFNLTINNTNDPPFFDNNYDGISDVISMPSPVVGDIQKTWYVNATDFDLYVTATENLTFGSSILSGPNLNIFDIQKRNATSGIVQFTPNSSDLGNYTAAIWVSDVAGAIDNRTISFEVVNQSLPPVINEVEPYANLSGQFNSSFSPTSDSSTNVVFPENTTVVFNLNFTDPDTNSSNIVVKYYDNGSLVATLNAASATNYTRYFNFFDAGSHEITAVVEDNYFSQDNFTWFVNVTNVNRDPILVHSIINRTINQTTSLSDEMGAFLDPDDDLNSDGIIDDGETNSLSFSMSPSSYLSASFLNSDVTLTPTLSGVTDVTYTATDSYGRSVDSNSVQYIVFFFPQQSSSTSSSSSSSSGGGGGGGGGGGAVITRPVLEPDPYVIKILTPQPITIYDNETVIAPLAVKNTGSVDLQNIVLSAQSDENVTLSFLDSTIDSLAVNQTFNTSLAITNFRYQGTYEVFVTAAVGEPKFNDTAVIYINSIEKGSEGDAVNTKITYARDLITNTPECGELMQIVDQADQAIRNGDNATADRLLNAVQEGCVYLKTQAAKEEQTPSLIKTLAGVQYINLFLGALLVILLAIGGVLVYHYGKMQ